MYRKVFEVTTFNKSKPSQNKWRLTTTKRKLIIALCVTLLCSIPAISLLLYTANPPDPMQNAITRAVNYLKGLNEPYLFLMLDVVHRRFGIEAFADSLERYDQVIDANPQQAPILRVFRRIAAYDNPLQDGDLESVMEDVDRISVPALYCDRVPLTNNYPSFLYDAASQGGYMLTHVLLACVWIQENGCELPVSDSYLEAVYVATAKIVNGDSYVDDLELEAAAFLYLAGQGARVNNTFIDRALEVQNHDGGWRHYSDIPGASYGHASLLGLMVLLHVEYPADSYPPMLAPA